jgi:hypothetical protein
MKDIGSAAENEVVLAFLQAEIDSPRWGLRARLPMGWAACVDRPVLGDATQDGIRLSILQQIRGFGANALLFQGWPANVVWRRRKYDVHEVRDFLYANYPSWVALSKGSRRVADGTMNLDSDKEIQGNVNGVIAQLANGAAFPPLIAATDSRRIILVEGHTRASAYACVRQPKTVEVIVGTSSQMTRWLFY